MPTIISTYDIHSGKLLISTGGRDAYKGPFRNSVILLKNHTLSGAFGVIINKPLNENEMPKNIPDVLKTANIPLYYGGPVSFPGVVIILRLIDGKPEIDLLETLKKKDPEILSKIVKSKDKRFTKIMFGYAGWGPLQLSKEIRKGGWSTIDFNEIYLSNLENSQIYDQALKTLLLEVPSKQDDHI
jgi:putative transcriptional regulator